LTSEFVFKKRFKCEDEWYQRFGGYEKFIENYAKYSDFQTIIIPEKSTFKTISRQTSDTTKQMTKILVKIDS
jgi:hypothetical protein